LGTAAAAGADSNAAPEGTALAAQLARPLALEDCIGIALEQNLSLAAARTTRDAALAGIDVAWGRFIPNLSVGTVGVRTANAAGTARDFASSASLLQQLPWGATVEAGMQVTDTRGDAVPAQNFPTVRVTQPLLRSGGWTATTGRLQDARLIAAGQEAELTSRRLQIVFSVTAAYYEILRRAQLIEVNKRAVERDSVLVEFSKAKMAATLATGRDVLSAEIAMAQDRGRLVNAEAAWRAALDQLSDILGVRIGRDLTVAPVDLAPPALSMAEEVWIARALQDNPVLQRGRVEVERIDLGRRIAGNARLPQLDLAVAYGQQRDAFAGTIQERAWEGGVTVAYPLLPKALNGTYRQATLDSEQIHRALVIAERQVVLAVRDGVRNLQRSQERIAILQKNIQGAQGKLDFADVNFRLGRASNLDITDAQRDLLDAETDLVNELVNYRLERARLESVLGGAL
jgi:outer membrane protein